MSRWTEGFEQHPFRTSFGSLSEIAERVAPNENASAAAIAELARFKRAVKYVEEMLSAVDPELTPLTVWEALNNYSASALQQVQAFESSRNDGHVNNSNVQVDHMITVLRPFAVVKGRAARVFQASATAFTEQVEQVISDVTSKRDEVLAKLTKASTDLETIKGAAADALSQLQSAKDKVLGDGDDKLLSQIEAALELVNKKVGEINETYNELLVGEDGTPSTKADVIQARDAVVKAKGEADLVLAATKSLIVELKAFGVKIFGTPDDSGVVSGGLSDQFQKRVAALEEFESQQQLKYSALNKQIESLLPGATSAGLATAYLQMKQSFDEPIKNATRLFFFSIGLLVLTSLFLTIETVSFSGITFVKPGEWTDILKALAQKLPFIAPIVWLGYFASKRRSEAQRLQQEYAHKEAFAKSYDGFKKQISDLGASDREMLEALIEKAVDAISHNASNTLDGKHGDNMPSQELLEKLVFRVVELTRPSP